MRPELGLLLGRDTEEQPTLWLQKPPTFSNSCRSLHHKSLWQIVLQIAILLTLFILVVLFLVRYSIVAKVLLTQWQKT